MTRRDLAAWCLVGLGALQMVGLATGIDALRGLGLATGASPLPLVFSAFRGYETFAASFALELETRDGRRIDLPVTAALYDRLDGPYNRRNAYGAVIAYGPALTSPAESRLVEGVLRFGLCGGPLAQRFVPGEDLRRATVVVRSRTAGSDREARLVAECAP